MSWAFNATWVTEDHKRAYAEAWLREPDEPLRALGVVGITPMDGSAYQAMQWFTSNLDVLAYKSALLEEFGERHFLPTKEQIAREILKAARSSNDPDDKGKLYKLYGDYMGYIEKPQPTTVIDNRTLTNNVMVVPATTSVDQWEQIAHDQQQKLMADVRK